MAFKSKTDKTDKRPAVPSALRYEIWKRDMGNVLEGKCPIPWCTARVEYKDFVLAHNVPFSRGGATDATNLRVTCASCNLGMGDRYTVDEWARLARAVASSTGTGTGAGTDTGTGTGTPGSYASLAPTVAPPTRWCTC